MPGINAGVHLQEEANRMSAVLWIVIGAVILAACAGGGKKKPARKGPYRIDRPHVIDADDYECSVCHRRFRTNRMVCPYCGARFTGRVEDEEDFMFEADELEAWEEDGF